MNVTTGTGCRSINNIFERSDNCILGNIFTYVPLESLDVLAKTLASTPQTTNRYEVLSKRVIQIAKSNEIIPIKNFVDDIVTRLDSEKEKKQKESLTVLSQRIMRHYNGNTQNLDKIKDFRRIIGSLLLDSLMELSEETINKLMLYTRPPETLRNILEIAKFERQLVNADLISNPSERENTLHEIIINLMAAGYVGRAIDATKMLSDIERRIHIVTTLSPEHEDLKISALHDIIKTLALSRNFERAYAVNRMLPGNLNKQNKIAYIRLIASATIGNVPIEIVREFSDILFGYDEDRCSYRVNITITVLDQNDEIVREQMSHIITLANLQGLPYGVPVELPVHVNLGATTGRESLKLSIIGDPIV